MGRETAADGVVAAEPSGVAVTPAGVTWSRRPESDAQVIAIDSWPEREPARALALAGGVNTIRGRRTTCLVLAIARQPRTLESVSGPLAVHDNPKELLLAELPWIERATAILARRHGLDGDEADDFSSWVKEKLIDDDYAVLRKHRGDAALTTYLTIVIANLFRDYRVRRWGRWRTSAEARRLGPLAVRLEVLLHRDGHTLDQAIEVLRSHGDSTPETEIRRIASRFPWRSNPRRPERTIPHDASTEDAADDQLDGSERNEAMARATDALTHALAELPAEDQLIFRLRIWDRMSVADVARALDLDQKPLYRRVERGQRQLRKSLEAAGIDATFMRELMESK